MCSFDDNVQQHYSTLVTGSLKGQTASDHEMIEGSSTTTHCLSLLSMLHSL